MPELIRLRRSTTNNIPSTLSYGEIAVFFDATGQSQFYVGNQNNLPILLNDDAIIITSIQSTTVNKPTVNGFYIFTATPLDGLPIGIALNDIAYLYNNVWYLTRSYFSAPATIKVGLVNQNVFTKNSNSWASLQNSIITGTSAKKLFKGSPIINLRTPNVGLTQNGANGVGIQVSTASTTPSTGTQLQYIGDTDAAGVSLLNAFAGNSDLNVTQIPIGTWNFRFSALASAATGVQLFQNVYQIVRGLNLATITGAGANTRTVTLTSGQFSGTNFRADASNILASYIQTPSGIYQITSITNTNVATITVPTTYVNETAVTFDIWNRLFSTANTPATAPIINTNTLTPYNVVYEQNVAYNVALTDRLGIIDIANFTNANRTVTVAFDGTANVNSVTTSIPLNHNDLPNIGNGANLNDTNHLTNAEYGNVALIPTKADKIPNSLALSNFATGGVIGLASATVDIFESFNISQTTTSQALTLPTPTTTTNTKIVYVKNVGTASFTMYNVNIQPNTFLSLIYNTLNGWLVHSGSSGGASGSTTLQIPNASDFTAYTPTFTGLGTPSSVKCGWARIGSNMLITASFAVGIPSSSVNASFSLPNANTISSLFSTSYATLGSAVWGGDGSTSARNYQAIARAGDGVVAINYQGGSAGTQNNSLTPFTGLTSFAAGQIITFNILIPIQGWTAFTSVNSVSQLYQTISTPLANAIANSVTTVSNIKVRYNTNGIGGNLDIACNSGTLTTVKITAVKLFNGSPVTNVSINSILTTSFTTFSGGNMNGNLEIIEYRIIVSNTEIYTARVEITGNTGTDLVLITLTRII